MIPFLLRVVLLLGVVAGAQWLTFQICPVKLPEFDFESRLKSFSPNGIPVVFMGDSVITKGGKNEVDPQSIIDHFATITPKCSVLALDHAAMFPAIEREILSWVEKRGVKPKLLILPVNLRAFSAGWRLNPGFQFPTARTALKFDGTISPAWRRGLFVWKVFSSQPVTHKEYETAYSTWAAEFAPELSKCSPHRKMFMEAYLYRLTRDDALVQDIQAILGHYREKGTRCLVYVTPVDVQSAGELDPTLVSVMQRNIDLLAEISRAEGATFLDLHGILNPEVFTWKEENLATEHLYGPGRARVAAELSTASQEMLGLPKTENK